MYLITGLILAALIVIAVLIPVAVTWFRRRRTRQITKSNGTFDDSAKKALNAAQKLIARNPRDVDAQFTVGRIHRYNIGEGDATPVTPAVATAYAAVVAEPVEMTDFMIDEVELAYLLALEQMPAVAGAQPAPLVQFTNIAAVGIPEARKASVSRRKQASSGAATKSDAVARYIDASITHTNDPQNVHDTAVINDLRSTLNKLPRCDNTMLAINEAREYVKHHCARAADANSALNAIAAGYSISTYGTTEDDIFARVWRRCDDPANAGSSAAMRGAIATALADCVEGGKLVCTSGRCNRMLGALVLLDHDPEVGKAMTLETYRNEIFRDVGKLIDAEIELAAKSSDPELSAVGVAYQTGAEPPAAAEEKFREQTKKKIDAHIDAYKGKLPDATLDRLREECYIVI